MQKVVLGLVLNGVVGEYTGAFSSTSFVVVVTAGTSDLPVAEEAVVILETLGVPVKLIDHVLKNG